MQTALNQMKEHGLLNMIEMKTEQFKEKFARKFKLDGEDIKNDKNRTYLYYFNVDLKFILKARMHLLNEEFNRQMDEARLNGHKYKCYRCTYGNEKIYEEVQANAMQMKCDNCKNELSVVEENMLKEEDQKKCREAI